MTSRPGVFAAAVGLVAVTLGGSIAAVPPASAHGTANFTARPAMGPPGTPIVVRGQTAPGETSLRISWSSPSGWRWGSTTGTSVTASSVGTFRVVLRVPPLRPGVYYLKLSSAGRRLAVQPFEVARRDAW